MNKNATPLVLSGLPGCAMMKRWAATIQHQQHRHLHRLTCYQISIEVGIQASASVAHHHASMQSLRKILGCDAHRHKHVVGACVCQVIRHQLYKAHGVAHSPMIRSRPQKVLMPYPAKQQRRSNCECVLVLKRATNALCVSNYELIWNTKRIAKSLC